MALFAREYTLSTRLSYFDCMRRSLDALWAVLDDFDAIAQIPRLDVPVFFLTGRRDWNTPAVLVEEWAAQLEAPHVEIVWLDEVGHMAPIEAPEAFQRALIEKLEP
jgi:pimeloyl-ACP methyl ester carboxylesterase